MREIDSVAARYVDVVDIVVSVVDKEVFKYAFDKQKKAGGLPGHKKFLSALADRARRGEDVIACGVRAERRDTVSRKTIRAGAGVSFDKGSGRCWRDYSKDKKPKKDKMLSE